MDAGMREHQTPMKKDALIRENGCSLNRVPVWMEGWWRSSEVLGVGRVAADVSSMFSHRSRDGDRQG